MYICIYVYIHICIYVYTSVLPSIPSTDDRFVALAFAHIGRSFVLLSSLRHGLVDTFIYVTLRCVTIRYVMVYYVTLRYD